MTEIIGEGDPIVNELERIMGKDYPIELIRLICNGVNVFGYQNPIIPEFPFFLFWSITNKCNLNCIYCLWEKKEYEEPSKKLCYNIINEFNEHGTIGVNLAGGEPLLRNDLFDIIKSLSKLLLNKVFFLAFLNHPPCNYL